MEAGFVPFLVSAQLLAIAFKVAAHLTEAVAAKLLAHRCSQHQCDHRFSRPRQQPAQR